MASLVRLTVCDTLIEADMLIAKLSQNDIPAWCHLRHSHNTSLQFISANMGYPVEVIESDFKVASEIITECVKLPECVKCGGHNIVNLTSNRYLAIILVWFSAAPATAKTRRKCTDCGNSWLISDHQPISILTGLIIFSIFILWIYTG